MWLLDSDICINILRGKFPSAGSVFEDFGRDQIKIPAIVHSELLLGAEKSDNPQANKRATLRFLSAFEIVPYDESCSVHYARLRSNLEQRGKVIGANDMLIAATALAHGASLVTGNLKEFMRIKGLPVENWAEVQLSD